MVPALFVWTLNYALSAAASTRHAECFGRTFGLVDVCPGVLSSDDILDFLLLEIFALEVAFVDDEVVGAREAHETVLSDKVLSRRVAGRDLGDAQHVAACWADCSSC